MPRILITGSRTWEDAETLETVLWSTFLGFGSDYTTVLVSGNCPNGADKMAENAWEGWGLKVERHPYMKELGRAGGPVRNQKMVDLGADVCLAFIMEGSKGAAGCAKAAEKAGIPTRRFTL